MPFVKVRDINIYYEIGGEGPRLLYISGTGGDLRRMPSIFESALGERAVEYRRRAPKVSARAAYVQKTRAFASDFIVDADVAHFHEWHSSPFLLLRDSEIRQQKSSPDV